MSPKSFVFSMFGSSPVSPLQQHMAKVQVCVQEIIPFLEAALAQDWTRAREVQKRIAVLEGEADALKKELRLHLPRGWMMPVSRRDLLEALRMQDKIANKTKDIAGLIIGRRMVFPPEIAAKLLEFARRCIDATAQAQLAINELDELVETGFRGHEVELVEKMITELDAIEADTDSLQVEVRDLLFSKEKELYAVDVMFMYNVIDWIGDLGDLAQRVGSRLLMMLAR
ncbi:MAG: TIGR00153 family protein [Spongiibacteraceae bacterium]|jgi:predicted phosphate transport protein (TIGR00153 family)|nr:TIGR00153 family protein [Spongiibacteraceae bacterium]